MIYWTHEPTQAVDSLMEASANPLLTSFTTQGRMLSTAMELCLLHGLTEHATTVLRHCPQAATFESEHSLGSPLTFFTLNASSWKDEEGRVMTRLLLEHGANPGDAVMDNPRLDSVGAKVRDWMAWAQSSLTEERFGRELDGAATQGRSGAGPRF